MVRTGVKAASKSKDASSDSYAVIRSGGKQYLVRPGDKLAVEKLEGSVGDAVTLSDVLLVSQAGDVKLGTPLLKGASVKAQIVAQDRGQKVLIYKKKRTTGYTKKQGHRQYYTSLAIESINA